MAQSRAEWYLRTYETRVVSTVSTKPGMNGQRQDILISTLVITRRSTYYLITLFLPAFGITLVCLVGLFTPSAAHQERVERCSMGMNALLNMSVILLIVSGMMPKSTNEFPRLGRMRTKYALCVSSTGYFILIEMFMCGLGTMFAVVVMHIHSLGELDYHPPHWLLRALCVTKTNSRWHISRDAQSNDDSFVDNADKRINSQMVSVRSACVTLSNEQCALLLQLFLHTLRSLRTEVMIVRQHVRDVRAFDDNCNLWMRVCFRIDVILLIVSNVANTSLLYIYAFQS